MQLELKLKNFINKNKLLHNADKILLGVSGGPDSLTMLHLFNNLKDYYKIEIAVAHLDHSFREKSKAEADFVEEIAEKLKLDFFRKTVDLPEIIKNEKISAEAAARKERMNFFKSIIKENSFDLLALAHHRDDQAETVLLNLFRGSGLKGLSGIAAVSKFNGIKIIHPLLEFSRGEILNYCSKKDLQPCFDSSNKESIYSRNIIRNEIFPIVENKINDKVKEVIARNTQLISAEDKYLANLALKKYKKVLRDKSNNKIAVDLEEFTKIDQVIQRRIYRQIYKDLNNNLDDLYLDHILEIEKLLEDDSTGRGVDIASGIRVEISYSNLLFFKEDIFENDFIEKKAIKIEEQNKIKGKYFIETKLVNRENFSFNNDPMQAAFDYHKLRLPLYIRSRKAGDNFIPLGMKGHQKVKDILIDAKVPKYERDQIPIIVDSNDNIIWLISHKISDSFKVSKETDKVLIIKFKYNLNQ